jgi:hypothetical protein
MTRFYDVEVTSVESQPRPLATSYLARPPHEPIPAGLASLVKRYKTKGEKVGRGEQVAWLRARVAELELAELLREVGELSFAPQARRLKGKKRQVKATLAAFADPAADLHAHYVDLDEALRPAFFVAHSLCALLRPDLRPLAEPEVTLRVRSRTLPEGAIPASNFEFLRGWIVRHLRDHDAGPNPWRSAFTLEELQGHWPTNVAQIYASALEERTKTQALARFIAPAPWISHCKVGDVFQSAA